MIHFIYRIYISIHQIIISIIKIIIKQERKNKGGNSRCYLLGEIHYKEGIFFLFI